LEAGCWANFFFIAMAFFLQAAFANLDIDKDWSGY
jgi:hypothetical protein